MDFYYFWDCIELVSKQAHWYFLYDMNPLSMPVENSHFQMLSTVVHPPLVPYMTAVLWKIFGQHLWVSHLFSLLWAYVLIYNTWKLVAYLFNNPIFRYWVFSLILLESTVLTQFAIASPDFILLTGFVIALRAVFQQKKGLLAIGLIFLCCVSARGIFTGVILFVVNLFYQYKLNGKLNYSILSKTLLPYLPVLTMLLVYFGYYLFVANWSFWGTGHADNTYTTFSDVKLVLKHFGELVVRIAENGRFYLYFVAIALILISSKKQWNLVIRTNLLMLVLLICLYVFFVVVTKMPFIDRYFMPHYLTATLLVFLLIKEINLSRVKVNIIAGIALILQITGNFWIYPDKIIKVWDGTLAHIPFYELRKECFDYIDDQNLNYEDVSGGFCLFDDRGFVELTNNGKFVHDNFIDSPYFIYSNVSPLSDEMIDDFTNPEKWTPVKEFKKGFVKIILLKNNTKKNTIP
ncbi:MAG: hypothetical protein ACK5KP_12145 [Paludibacteraceae bacterium]